MLKSATFLIGLLLALGAFGGFLLLGNFLAPPPAKVVVALRDIPPYTPLDANLLGVDAQHLNSRVLATLVQKEELDEYLGGFVTTPIFAGEPLRKSAIVMAGNPLASKRLALALTDPNRVAAVVPVDAKTAPSQIVTGDYVDLVISMAPGNLPTNNSNNFGEILSGQERNQASFGFGPSAIITPTNGSFPAAAISSSAILSGALNGGAMNLPVTKAVIRTAPVLAVSFEQAPNPTYASAGFGEEANSAPQPAYIRGDITSITVSIPRASAELLNFGIDNGKVHVILLPIEESRSEFVAHRDEPTLGVSWNDVLTLMIQERQQLTAALALPTANNGTSTSNGAPTTNVVTPTSDANVPTTPTTVAQLTVTPTAINTPSVNPTATQVAGLPPPTIIAGNSNVVPTPPNAGASQQQNQLDTGLDVMALVIPLACGFLFLVLSIVAIRVIRRRSMPHVTP